MTGPRDTLLGAVRRSLGRQAPDPDAQARILARIAEHPLGPIPERGRSAGADAVTRFVAEAETAKAEIVRLADIADLPGVVARTLAERNLPSRVRVAGDGLLETVDWTRAAPLAVERGAADPADTAAVSVARAGVAETGTLVLCADAANPGTLNSLPLHHVVVLPEDRIVGHYEQVWAEIRNRPLPRAVVWTTGPSRTADIEQELLLGAHGPQSLQIVLIGRPTDGT